MSYPSPTRTLFDLACVECSQGVTKRYSTSFSLGIRLLHKSIRPAIYAIYGFVRFADEIVDTFHQQDQGSLLQKYKQDTYDAIATRISLNPILQAFQLVVHQYGIEQTLIEAFFRSMEMDLDKKQVYDEEKYKAYIVGSAEVVGLMCLCVFVEGDPKKYEYFKPSAIKLGAAFQKINFLRDIQNDFEILGRNYFPNINLAHFDKDAKQAIEKDIQGDFDEAIKGIQQLPQKARKGVHLAYLYYRALLQKIKKTPAEVVLQKRVRIPDIQKIILLTRLRLKR